MRISSRAVAVAGLLMSTLFCCNSAGAAADWPRRTVRLIAPVPAGGGSDFSARLFAEQLSQRWGQPVIVENRPGADGVMSFRLSRHRRRSYPAFWNLGCRHRPSDYAREASL